MLSMLSDFSEHLPSPFDNLKCLTLEEKWKIQGRKLAKHVLDYLVSSSQGAKILKQVLKANTTFIIIFHPRGCF